jgi:hypothetical protein
MGISWFITKQLLFIPTPLYNIKHPRETMVWWGYTHIWTLSGSLQYSGGWDYDELITIWL